MGGKTVYGQPAALLHEEAEVFQRLLQVAAAVLQVNSGVWHDIQQPLSLRQPQRTGQGKTVQDHQDCQQADWQTCPRPPGTLWGESSKVPGGHPPWPHSPAVYRAAGRHFSKIWKTDQLSGQDKPVPFVFSVRLCNAWSDLVTWDRPTADRIHVAHCSSYHGSVFYHLCFYTNCLNWSNYDFFYLCGYLLWVVGGGGGGREAAHFINWLECYAVFTFYLVL